MSFSVSTNQTAFSLSIPFLHCLPLSHFHSHFSLFLLSAFTVPTFLYFWVSSLSRLYPLLFINCLRFNSPHYVASWLFCMSLLTLYFFTLSSLWQSFSHHLSTSSILSLIVLIKYRLSDLTMKLRIVQSWW